MKKPPVYPVSAQEEGLPRGGCLPRGVSAQCLTRRGYTLPPVDRQTPVINITFPQLLLMDGNKKVPGVGRWGMVSRGGEVGSGGWSRGVYSPVNRLTDKCKNITFPQLCLRAVIEWNFRKTVIKLFQGSLTRPGKPRKLKVHLENLEISWNFEKFNKYHGKMTWNLEKLEEHSPLTPLEQYKIH